MAVSVSMALSALSKRKTSMARSDFRCTKAYMHSMLTPCSDRSFRMRRGPPGLSFTSTAATGGAAEREAFFLQRRLSPLMVGNNTAQETGVGRVSQRGAAIDARIAQDAGRLERPVLFSRNTETCSTIIGDLSRGRRFRLLGRLPVFSWRWA